MNSVPQLPNLRGATSGWREGGMISSGLENRQLWVPRQPESSLHLTSSTHLWYGGCAKGGRAHVLL